MFAFLSAPIDTPPSLGSLGGNQLCGVDGHGRGTYTTEGITKLCEALRGSAVTSLRCVTAHTESFFVSTPVDGPHNHCRAVSLANNQLCGLCEGTHGNIHGTYTIEGITKLCEGLKGSAVTSLKCATRL